MHNYYTERIKMHKTGNRFIKGMIRDRELYLIILLPFLYYVIFKYIPMYGITLAFKDFQFGKGILGSPWIGFKWFIEFFNSYYFFRLLRNTFLLNFYSLIIGFPIPIIFALCLNEIKNNFYRKTAQTISYFPHFISTVIIVGMMYSFFSPNSGIVNEILNRFGHESINFFDSVKWFRPLYIGSSIWQGFGFSSIIYLAVITGINPELYEAIAVDGGNRFHKIYYITLPSLRPTIIILFILSLGSLFSIGFEKIILMYNPGIYEVSDVIQTYVYRRGIETGDMAFATAVGFFNTVLNFVFILTFNKISKMIGEAHLW